MLPLEVTTELVALSRRYGGDPAFVLAGGGNTSFKKGNRLWVKASGHALSTIGPEGFVELDRDALESMLAADWPYDSREREALFIERVMASRIHPQLNQRPSVEALIHHLIPDSFVVHTHPGTVNALTCCINGEKITHQLFCDDVLWQPYVDPGVILAKTLKRSLAQHEHRTSRAPVAIFLANHGLIVSADRAPDIENTSARLLSTIRQHIDATPALQWTQETTCDPSQLLDCYAKALTHLRPSLHVVSDAGPAIAYLACTDQGRAQALAGPLTPDQIVYCRSVPILIENPSPDPDQTQQQLRAALIAYESAHEFDPWIALIAGAGMIAFRESTKLAQVTRSIYLDAAVVYHDAARLGGVHVLDRRDRQFIEQWEVEAYRRSIAAR
jgi:rhamnose utilization protein RhaD (predicted bifunctional aldolase and dehydrogenase)